MKKKIFLMGLITAVLCFASACVVTGTGSASDSYSDASKEDSVNVETYYTVTFDSDGGSAIESVSVLYGEKITEPNVPEKSSVNYEYEFIGWFYEGEEWDFENDTVTEEITLIARWKIAEKYTEPFLPKD